MRSSACLRIAFCGLAFSAMCLAAPTVSVAQEKKDAYATPEEAAADPDFAVQGEYVGEIETPDGKLRHGAQVVARGGGKFLVVGYHGGLPGENAEVKKSKTADAATENGAVKFQVNEYTGEIRDGKLTLTREGNAVGVLEKVNRTSPTLNAPPAQNAVVLFQGKDVNGFGGSKVTEDGLLVAGATTGQRFYGFTLHLEFRTPYQPTASGQGRGNSGFYAQGRYEVQVLDSFGLDGKNNECGGIYGIAEPKVNMCLPPLAWQTYDVDYTPATFDAEGKKTADARITVKHNGVVIHEDVALPHATTASPVKEGPEPGPIYLQDHGNPVRYRNIWLVEKK